MIPPGKKASIKNVATQAGVSYPVASLVLANKKSNSVKYGEETRLRVLRAADELGYRPNRSARNFASKRHGIISLVAQSLYNIPQMVFNILALEAGKNDQLIVYDRCSKDVAPRCLAEDMADGVILCGIIPDKWSQLFDKAHLPVLHLNTDRTSGPNVITYDEEEGMRQLVNAALSNKRRQIMFFCNDNNHYSNHIRQKTLIELSKKNRMLKPIIIDAKNSFADSGFVFRHLKDHPKCDAMIISERMTLNAVMASKEMGKNIGVDMSILIYAEAKGMPEPFELNLQSIELPQDNIGKLVSESINRIIMGEVLPTQMVTYRPVSDLITGIVDGVTNHG